VAVGNNPYAARVIASGRIRIDTELQNMNERFMRLFGCVLLGAFACLPLCTQLGAQTPPALRDTVRGVVYDSLGGEPLAGAFVVAAPSATTAIADSLGRFEIVGDTLITALTAYHPVLDQSGLGSLNVVRPLARARWHDAELSTPSLNALWPRLCPSRRPEGLRSAIVTGTARLADNKTRVSGAKVIVQWARTEPSADVVQYATVDVLTDSLGDYVACAVSAYTELSIAALSSEAQSGVIMVPTTTHPLRRVDLVLMAVEAPVRQITLEGRVVGRDGRALANASVSVDGRDSAVVSEADGRFRLDSVPLGSRMLWVRSIGYSPVTQVVQVLETDNPPLNIGMDPTVELESVRVTERFVVRRDREEFDFRKRAGFGRYVDSADIARAPILRTLLAGTMRGVTVTPRRGPTSEFNILGRGRCEATVFWDGVLSTMDDVNRIPKDDLVAIEYYTTTALAPVRYIMVARDDCAVVLFWTKRGLRP
jgi:hypothetical protein